MRNTFLVAFAVGVAALGMTGAQAAPAIGGRTLATEAPKSVENVRWVRVCNWHHHRRVCRTVWVGHRHHH